MATLNLQTRKTEPGEPDVSGFVLDLTKLRSPLLSVGNVFAAAFDNDEAQILAGIAGVLAAVSEVLLDVGEERFGDGAMVAAVDLIEAKIRARNAGLTSDRFYADDDEVMAEEGASE